MTTLVSLPRPVGPLPAERLYQITAPHFCAGLVVRERHVMKPAPILSYMRGWELAEVRDYCRRKGWRVVEVTDAER